MNRYARQITLPELGETGQVRLKSAHVLVVGAGGLAAPVLQYLVGAGIGGIRLVDPDVVDHSNLHRQTLFRQRDIGQSKVNAATAHLAGLNPDCLIKPLQCALDPANVAMLCEGVDLVLDCADSFAASYILSDHCLANQIPLISASVTGLSGYVGGFCAKAPSLRALFPDLPQRMGNCAEDGVLGPVVGMIGAMQAQMAMAVIARIAPSPLGQLTTIDAQAWRFGGFRFDGAPEPENAARFIASQDLRADDFIADLRAAGEAPLAHPNARRLNVPDFGPTGPRPAPNQRAVLCCRSGLRAWQAAERLRPHWGGEITLVAFGDVPNSQETQGELA